jgi:hypothetical protein
MQPRKVRAQAGKSAQRWSARVTRNSDALDLKSGVPSRTDPKRIAADRKELISFAGFALPTASKMLGLAFLLVGVA